MEADMLGMAIKAAQIMVDPTRLAFLALGVVIGLVLGVIPGLGGLVGLSLLLPFTFNLDPFTALAFLMGLQAVVVTSDTIPAVLFGVPGTVGSAATILDGYPMAQKGEAGRAFGAAFTASVIGGLFGALLLGLSVPILRPVLLHIETPEVLAFVVFGLSLVAVLSGSTPIKGLGAGCIGLMMATAGDDPQTGTLRWTMDTMYLFDGFNVVPIALGLFALPELADMAINRKSIAGDSRAVPRRHQSQGVLDVLKNWFLVLRCSTIGAGLGAIPGIGASVIDWIAYAHAIKSEKDAKLSFGKGDVRGVIASESSNNAKEGGALIPTIAFGVPGTASMALLLGAFLIHGINPGTDMLNKHLDVTYTLVWSIAIANIIGAGICFVFADQLAKIAVVRIGILAPVIIAITFVGAFQGSKEWGDLYVLLGLGVFGWIMKRLRWPRPPLILGFVLGDIFENSMFISVERYGFDLLSRPIVIILFALTLYGIFAPAVKSIRARRRAGRVRDAPQFGLQKPTPDTIFTLALMVAFAFSLYLSWGWDFGARLVPQVIGWSAVAMTAYLLLTGLFFSEEPLKAAPGIAGIPHTQSNPSEDVHFDITADYGDLTRRAVLVRAMTYFAWCLFFLGAASVVGLLPAMALFLIGYIRFEGRERWRTTLAVVVPVWAIAYVLFHKILIIPWPQALLGEWLPFLRSSNWLNLV
ncbi:MAG: tripartite tricarboxylate transporter permease [Alphaproteobacteria bacterium]|nr:tripartite tricarboxylate transporter permease [Alphaproteobacteria bacterium]